jgi:HEPN domain-containing protein
MSTIEGWRGWAQKAENDLRTISILLDHKDAPLEIICFHAQQAAEKYLKGFLVARSSTVPKIHDLPSLLAECAHYDAGFKRLEDDCRRLNAYGVAPRYPESDPVTDAQSRAVVDAAHRVKAEVLKHLLP